MATTIDSFLGGALQVEQPARGYRAGLDAVLLAAACPTGTGRPLRVLDCGAGVGVVGLAIATRLPEAQLVLAEANPDLVGLAHANITRNGLDGRVRAVSIDVGLGGAALHGAASDSRLSPSSFDVVVANPPYWSEAAGTASPDRAKAASHAMPQEALARWCAFMATAVRPGGVLLVIYPAAGIADLLAAIGSRFGALRILPLHPRQGEPATRIIVEGRQGSRAPPAILTGRVLHGTGHAFRPEIDLVLRHGAALAL